MGITIECFKATGVTPVTIEVLNMHVVYVMVKLMVYADAARGLGAHLCDIGPRACGGKEPITPGHRARVTTRLPQFTFRDSEVTTPCLTSRTYSLLGEQGGEGIGKTAHIFPLRPGDRTQDLSVVSQARYRYTTESSGGVEKFGRCPIPSQPYSHSSE